MQNVTDWLRLVFRLCLSCTLMIEAVVGLVPQANAAGIRTVSQGITNLFFQDLVLSTLYFVMSIWLLFGIKTREVASMSGLLLILPAMAFHGVGTQEMAVKLALAAVLAAPLALFGAGRYSVYDKFELPGGQITT